MRTQSGDSAGRPRALILSPEAPYPAVGGGALRTASLVEHLGRRYELDVIVFHQPGAPDPRAAFPPALVRRVDVLELPEHSRSATARGVRNLRRFFAGRAPLHDRFGGFEREITRLLEGRAVYDLAVVEHSWCAPYHAVIAPHATRTLLDLHNIDSVFYARSAAAEGWPQRLLYRRFAAAAGEIERRWFPCYSRVLVPSQADADRILPMSACAGVYPNAIPLVPRPVVAEEDVVAFSGNLEYEPNVSGIRFFQRAVWPQLQRRWPALRWRVIGKNPGRIARFLSGDPRIEITGPVENAVETLAAAKVVVVPLLAGSGTRVKILEAWAAGRAVVSTALGAEGLDARDGEHLVIADGGQGFAAAVSGLLESPERRAALSVAGRALYEECYTWDRASESLAQFEI